MTVLVGCAGKRRFDCEAHANKVIDCAKDRRKHGALRRAERRAYHCEACRGWHVTSR